MHVWLVLCVWLEFFVCKIIFQPGVKSFIFSAIWFVLNSLNVFFNYFYITQRFSKKKFCTPATRNRFSSHASDSCVMFNFCLHFDLFKSIINFSNLFSDHLQAYSDFEQLTIYCIRFHKTIRFTTRRDAPIDQTLHNLHNLNFYGIFLSSSWHSASTQLAKQ